MIPTREQRQSAFETGPLNIQLEGYKDCHRITIEQGMKCQEESENVKSQVQTIKNDLKPLLKVLGS